MELRNSTNFIIFSLIFLIGMGGIVFFFSQHPMGSDFTRYQVLSGEDLNKLENFNEQRVAVRGKLEAENPEELIKAGDQKDIIAYIDKQFDPTKGKAGATINMSRNGIDSKLLVGSTSISVRGLPVQIFDIKHNIVSPQDPNRYLVTTRQGNDYSIFGTIQKGITGKPVLVPYRITDTAIQEVIDSAAKTNKQMDFIRYLSIFAIAAIYITALLRGGIFGPPEPESEKENVAVKESETGAEGETETGESEKTEA